MFLGKALYTLTEPLSTQMYKWVLGNLLLGFKFCDGLASHPGRTEILLVASYVPQRLPKWYHTEIPVFPSSPWSNNTLYGVNMENNALVNWNPLPPRPGAHRGIWQRPWSNHTKTPSPWGKSWDQIPLPLGTNWQGIENNKQTNQSKRNRSHWIDQEQNIL